jgi:hypothetical protein
MAGKTWGLLTQAPAAGIGSVIDSMKAQPGLNEAALGFSLSGNKKDHAHDKGEDKADNHHRYACCSFEQRARDDVSGETGMAGRTTGRVSEFVGRSRSAGRRSECK